MCEDRKNNHFSSFNPTNKYDTKSDAEFDFWGLQKVSDGSNFECAEDEEEDFLCDYIHPLWRTRTSRNIESSPLLRLRHHRHTSFSPGTQSQAIAEGRKELMEMIRNMPESSYELSLKDIVDEQAAKGMQEEPACDNSGFSFNSEADVKKQKRKQTKSADMSRKISRSGSMEKETFLIKMFIPTYLSGKTKVKAEKRSTLSQSSSMDGSVNNLKLKSDNCSRLSFNGSENLSQKERWIKRFLVAGDRKDSSSSSNSSSSSTSRVRRHSNSCCSPPPSGCWSFFCTTKNKHRDCIL